MKEENTKPPRMVQINIMITEDVMRELEALSKQQARSRSSLAFFLLRKGLEAHLESVG